MVDAIRFQGRVYNPKYTVPKYALSVRSPWWWYILHGGKDVENRSWSTRYRGSVLIHASSWFQREQIEDEIESCSWVRRSDVPLAQDFKALSGHYVGVVDIVDCVWASESPWFNDAFGFVLANPQPLVRPIRGVGRLGFMRIDREPLIEAGFEIATGTGNAS